MAQLDHEMSTRFAKSCATAAFAYARAASAAYAAFADQALDFWSNANRAAHAAGPSPSDDRDLRWITGPRPYRSAVEDGHVVVGPESDFSRMTNAWAETAVFGPARAWWNLFPFESPPQSWPMAYAMMNAGVPRSVALPAAEGNLAAMDAAQLASQSIGTAFSPYRSAGGFAVVRAASPWMAALIPASLALKFPWAA